MLTLLSKVVGAGIAVSVLAAAVLAYFVTTIDPATGTAHDGLGRLLSEPPLWAQLLITEENRWAGLGWHLVDVIWFFGGFWVAFIFFGWSETNKSE